MKRQELTEEEFKYALQQLDELSKMFERVIKPSERNDTEKLDVPIVKPVTHDTTKIGVKAPLLNPEDEGMLREPQEDHNISLDSFSSPQELIGFIKVISTPDKIKHINKKQLIKMIFQYKEMFDIMLGSVGFFLIALKYNGVHISEKQLQGEQPLSKQQLVSQLSESSMKKKIKRIYSVKK